MFDTVEIGRRISRLRKERDMTQPALADRMGVSFQAVSNWERGTSMPDIGKLPELADALGVSVDELLGGGRGGELIRSVIDGSEEAYIQEKNVTLSEAGEAAPLLKPKQVTRIVKTIEERAERREQGGGDSGADADGASGTVRLEQLATLAPFLDEEYLDELALRLAPVAGLHQLVSIAPFISEETMDRLAEQAVLRNPNLGELASIAPFVSEEALGRIALSFLERGGTPGEIASIAPFLDEDVVGKLAVRFVKNGGNASQLASLAPFLDEDGLDKVVQAALKGGRSIGEISALFPFLSKDTLRELVERAIKQNDMSLLANVSKFL